MTISDAKLTQYLAGELSEDEATELEAMVEADPALEARLMALDPFAEVVARAFEAVTPPPVSPAAPVAQDAGPVPVRTGWRGAAVGMVASLALVVGLGGGWWLAGQQSGTAEPWVVAVADYQVLYQPQTVAVLSPAPGEVAGQLARAGAAIGADLAGFETAPLGGSSLLRAQVLGLGDRAIIQMVYQLPDGTPLALCLTEKGSGALEQMGVQISGLTASRWQTEAHDILLIGAVSHNEIAALTEVARQLTDQI